MKGHVLVQIPVVENDTVWKDKAALVLLQSRNFVRSKCPPRI